MTIANVPLALAALVASATVLAQSPHIRPDALEVKRIAALATVQRLSIPAARSFAPEIQIGTAGKGCTFNIGDVASAQQAGGTPERSPAATRKGLSRIEYVTVVEASPICVQR